MKQKFTVLLAVFCLTVLLSGCNAAGRAEAAIDRIGTVTLESEELIEEAEALYNALPPEQQAKVENAAELKQARRDYDRQYAVVAEACRAVDAIGTVTADSGSAIAYAQEKMDALYEAGLAKYAADKEPVLTAAKAAYAKAACDAGEAALRIGDFRAAYSYFHTASTMDTAADTASRVKKGLAECSVGLAQERFNAGDLEKAMELLDESKATYGSDTANAAALRKELEQYLSQHRPYNGKVIHDSVGWGYGELTIQAGSQDACVKLENVRNASKYILVYVRANEETTVQTEDGTYILKYTTGPFWYGDGIMFGKNGGYARADDHLTFRTTSTQYTSYEITLYTVLNGNMSTEDIEAEDF